MRSKSAIFLLCGVVAAAAAAAFTLHPVRGERPPIHGAMSNFIALSRPIPAPDTQFTDPGHGVTTLARYRGKTILLNLWATWCGPCVEEMPSLLKLKREKANQSFDVVNIAEDHGGTAAVNSFLSSHHLTELNHYVDAESAVGLDLNINGLPTTFLIDPEGRILGKLEGKADWGSRDAADLIDWYVHHVRRSAG